MPQTFQVLRCYKCFVFQVHQVRKDNKWVCKMCNEKQSVKRYYGLGTGKDCRLHVQKLNKLRGEKEGTPQIIDSDDSEIDDNTQNCSNNRVTNKKYPSNVQINEIKESKWTAYIDKPEVTVEDNEPEYYDEREVVLEIPKKRKINSKIKQSKFSKIFIQNSQHCEIEANVDHNNNVTRNNNKKVINESRNLVSAIPAVFHKKETQKELSSKPNKSHLILEKNNKASRWDQFVEEEDQYEYSENSENQNFKKDLFSLCDDNDIDSVLDF